jgi:hypothetical protein
MIPRPILVNNMELEERARAASWRSPVKRNQREIVIEGERRRSGFWIGSGTGVTVKYRSGLGMETKKIMLAEYALLNGKLH